jgi:hypothetical protein
LRRLSEINSLAEAKSEIRKLSSPMNKIFWSALYSKSWKTQWALDIMMCSPALDIKDAAVLCGFAVRHVHEGELDRKVAPRSGHPFAIGVHSPAHEEPQEQQECARTWKTLGRATPGHIYERPAPPSIAAEPCQLNDITTNICAGAETLLAVPEPCYQLMYIASPRLMVF